MLHKPLPSAISTIFLFLLSAPLLHTHARPRPRPYSFSRLQFRFSEAPDYRNSDDCPTPPSSSTTCNPNFIHISMTLDTEYLRGSIAAIHSILRHTSCPQNIFFHFITPSSSSSTLPKLVRSTFPSLKFHIYFFKSHTVSNLISSSVRIALENPLNYARNYLGDILHPCITRVIYLDSDLILVDDVQKLWDTPLLHSTVIAAPEYCHANFTTYFTDTFWSDPELSSSVFSSRRRRPCYFNTGVMVMDMVKWRRGEYRFKIEKWMELQRSSKRIYELGSLPPFLLVFAGEIEPIHHRWNQHGLGGDNVYGSCRGLHPGPVSLLHWSGKGKPWVRLDENRACPLDRLWEPYDLYNQRQRVEVI